MNIDPVILLRLLHDTQHRLMLTEDALQQVHAEIDERVAGELARREDAEVR